MGVRLAHSDTSCWHCSKEPPTNDFFDREVRGGNNLVRAKFACQALKRFNWGMQAIADWSPARRQANLSMPMGGSMKAQFDQMMGGLNDVEAFLPGSKKDSRHTCAPGS